MIIRSAALAGLIACTQGAIVEPTDDSEAELDLSSEMSTIWATFATSHAPPNAWPQHDGTHTRMLSSDGPVVADYHGDACRFWARFTR